MTEDNANIAERVTDALAVAAGTPGFGSDMRVWSELASTVLEAAAAVLALQHQLAEMEAALEPFAALGVPESWPDNRYGIETGVTAGQIRKARSTLKDRGEGR